MAFDIDMIKLVYTTFGERVHAARNLLGKPLTLSEKILYAHLFDGTPTQVYERGKSYVNFAPDRVAMQDATAQMALLQFMQAGKKNVAVPSTVHCDHLILAKDGAKADLKNSITASKEVFDFLESVSKK
jgi:aconitate hydratase